MDLEKRKLRIDAILTEIELLQARLPAALCGMDGKAIAAIEGVERRMAAMAHPKPWPPIILPSGQDYAGQPETAAD